MPFLITYKIEPTVSSELQDSLRSEHIAYVGRQVGTLVAQLGRLYDDTGSSVDGGYVLLDTDDRNEADAFYLNDPYVIGHVWSAVIFGRVDPLLNLDAPPPSSTLPQ